MGWTVTSAVVKEHTEEEAGLAYLSVTLAERSGAGGRLVEFQVALDGDDRDDGYCVMDSLPDFGEDLLDMAHAIGTHKTLYGGVKSYRIDGDELSFRFSWKAQRLFGWPRTLKLTLAVPMDQRDALGPGLAAVFAVAPPGERPPRVLV
jgi:hypothetical protein